MCQLRMNVPLIEIQWFQLVVVQHPHLSGVSVHVGNVANTGVVCTSGNSPSPLIQEHSDIPIYCLSPHLLSVPS